MAVTRILHVGGEDDDHEALAAIVREMPETEFHSIGTGEALAALTDRVLDLLLIDVMQSSEDVVALLRAAANPEAPQRVPVIVIAPIEMGDRLTACLRRGADDYVYRPFDPANGLLIQRRIVLTLQRWKLREHSIRLSAQLSDTKAIVVPAQAAAAEQHGNPFVPREFLDQLERRSLTDLKAGDHVQRDMTVLFTDIRDFTTMAENLTPKENFGFLSSYLGRVAPIIRKNGGFVEKFLGDGVMALFGDAGEGAIKAGVDILNEVVRYNLGRRRAGYRQISVGIGLHRGTLILGTIGEDRHLQTTVIADAVNVASRIEGMTKQFGVPLLVSDAVVDALPAEHAFRLRHLGAVKAKGKEQPTEIYECFSADSPENVELKEATLEQFNAAMADFRKGKFISAGAVFRRIADMNPNDAAAAYYRDRCALDVMKERAPGRFDGAERLRTK